MVNLENILLFLIVVLFLLVVIMDFISSRYFKKHEAEYNQLLSEYRQKGYDLDLVTNYASFFWLAGKLSKNNLVCSSSQRREDEIYQRQKCSGRCL